jgi:predicted DNA-binding WGR domain protein
MLKLYKRLEGVLHYHEAWSDDEEIIEHWGKVGTRGDLSRHNFPPGLDEEEAIDQVLREAREKGFRELDETEVTFLVIEFEIAQNESSADLEKRHELESRLDELLGWTGLGHCDGGSIGSGSMEVACLVVDVDIAKQVIATDLAGTKFSDYRRFLIQ